MDIKFDFSKINMPKNMPKKLPWPLIITIAVLVAIVGGVYLGSIFWTEVLWYKQINYQGILFTRWIAKAVIVLVSVLVFSVTMYATSFFAIRGHVDGMQGSAIYAMRKNRAMLKAPLRVVPLLVGLWRGVILATNWEAIALWWNSTPFGKKDPQFGYDISFYTFKLGFYSLLLEFILILVVANLVYAAIIYYLYGDIKLAPKLKVDRRAWIHLSVMIAFVALVIGSIRWLSRFSLLTNSGNKFDGANYTDINAVLPAMTILAVISILIALLFFFSATRSSWKWPISGVAVLIISSLVIGNLYPMLIQRFKVDPNAQALEAKYIQRNIDATLNAYGLDKIEKKTYKAVTTASPGQLREDSESTASIRLLDPTIISPTFRQVQQNRQYYDFDSEIYVDRYNIEGKQRDTVIAVRELNQDGLGAAQRTWVNDHTVYTHGFGVVAAFGNTTQYDGRPAFWEQGIPSEGQMGEYEPRVYFGKNSPQYSIVGAPKGTKPQELDYPDDKAKNGQVNTTFTGDAGPNIGGSILNKLLYAIKFGSYDILFSKQVNEKSQILYDRNPILRVQKVAPYLTLDKQMYPAVVDTDGDPKTKKRLVWIVDGYTTSNNYPYSAHYIFNQATSDSTRTSNASQFKSVNYVRNSVKAVVDAYDGSVKLYAWDDKDPVLKTWNKIYNTKVRPISEISGDLMAHLRYPEDLFKMQRTLLSRYHVTDARSFYSGGDFWKNPTDPTKSGSDLQPPFYLTMQMPDQKEATFSLTSVFVPGGNTDREILTGFLAVDSETGNTPGKKREGFGKLRLLELPRDLTVPGPGQVQNTFNSTNKISTELNLLAQQSSQVVRGNLLTLPVGGGLLYVQPVYVQASKGTTFPLLRFVLVSFGDKVGFASTLQESLDQVFGGDSGVTTEENKVDEGSDKSQNPEQKTLTSKAKLDEALHKAKKAINDSNDALKKQDWAAYGKAQSQLQEAIESAVKAQTEIDSEK
ncbi:UPF0182 family protein [Actinomyces sp. zg-332]|uniref:UPF0182 family membrane protein n=1 Tax=Actinomyces sp. zg-332 TaxID=2708340 RepID=UPI0014231DDF|nr:UPF0182 family protein [Actinomyces sp. zg-332]QPK94529.1 UPF0182 family protein [Actinomyces sp. zg-332]